MFFNLSPGLPYRLRRYSVFATVLMLLGSLLAGSLDSWHYYSDLGKTVIAFDVATVSSEAGVAGDIEPAIFPEIPPVSATPPPGQAFAVNEVRTISAVFAPHDRPPTLA